MNFSLVQIKKVLQNKKYIFFDSGIPFNVNIIGVRKTIDSVVNTFEDEIYLIFRSNDHIMQFLVFPATTKPGLVILNHPINKDGAAILVPGQHRSSHVIGLHKGQYIALVQNKPLPVYRDNDLDNHFDFDPLTIKSGTYGLNIHHGDPFRNDYQVNDWSAGCQVIEKISDYNIFIEVCKKANDLVSKYFTYTLLLDTDFINL